MPLWPRGVDERSKSGPRGTVFGSILLAILVPMLVVVLLESLEGVELSETVGVSVVLIVRNINRRICRFLWKWILSPAGRIPMLIRTGLMLRKR